MSATPTPSPTPEHEWLQQLVGRWTYEAECLMQPGEPPTRMAGSEVVHQLGPLWVIGEGDSHTPDGQPMTSRLTLGYDPGAGRFVGTFIASVMPYMFVYDGGELDDARTTLTLSCEGPNFTGDGMARYRDVVAIEGPDVRTMASQALDERGEWRQFMLMRYRRAAE